MNIIADTNIFLAVALEEDSKDDIIQLTVGCDLHAPEILYYEMGNALSAMVKRRQLDKSDVLTVYQILQKIPVTLSKVDIAKSLSIVVQHNIYAYDAYFLQCALSLSSPLITLDGRMKMVAKEMNITVLE